MSKNPARTRAASALVWRLWLTEAAQNGVSRRDIAARLGVTVRAIQHWQLDGVPSDRWAALDDLPLYWMGVTGKSFAACVADIAAAMEEACSRSPMTEWGEWDGSGLGSGDGQGRGSGLAWGSGLGTGDGYGWGDGDGDGWGDGYGDGDGLGYGDGDGLGYGRGSGGSDD